MIAPEYCQLMARYNRWMNERLYPLVAGMPNDERRRDRGAFFGSIHDAIAEPVVYMIDRFVVGGFYRVHAARGRDENLNAPGAQFVPLAFESPCIPDLRGPAGCPPNRFYAYGVVARLAQLAAAIEVGQLEAEAPATAEALA